MVSLPTEFKAVEESRDLQQQVVYTNGSSSKRSSSSSSGPAVVLAAKSGEIETSDRKKIRLISDRLRELLLQYPMPYVPRRERTPRYEVLPSESDNEVLNPTTPPLMASARAETKSSETEADQDKMHDEDGSETTTIQKKRKRKRNIVKNVREREQIHRRMPDAMRAGIEAMGGSDIVLVIQKILTDTDMSSDHGRLSLPPHKLCVDVFLTEQEERMLESNNNDDINGGSKKKKGMTVRIYNRDLNERNICFKKWKIGCRQTFCLMTQWNSFVKENKLKSGDQIQLWYFRIARPVVPPAAAADADAEDNFSTNLCFGLVKISEGVEEEEGRL